MSKQGDTEHKEKTTFFHSTILSKPTQNNRLEITIFNKTDVLLINNDPKEKIIDGILTTKLIWGFTKALESDFKISILNTQSVELNSSLNSINISRILSFLSRIMLIFKGFPGWKNVENYLDKSIKDFYKVRLNWKRIYRDR